MGLSCVRLAGLGKVPGEYTNIYDAQIDEVNNRIYMLPWTSNQLLVLTWMEIYFLRYLCRPEFLKECSG